MKEIGLYNEVKKCSLFKKYNPNERPQILNEFESRNIDMPSNREYVRQYFLRTISEQYTQDESDKNNMHTNEYDFMNDNELSKNNLEFKKSQNNTDLLNFGTENKDSEEGGSLDTRTEFEQGASFEKSKATAFKPDFGVVNKSKLKEIGNEKNYIHYRTQQNNKTYDKEATLYYYKRLNLKY